MLHPRIPELEPIFRWLMRTLRGCGAELVVGSSDNQCECTEQTQCVKHLSKDRYLRKTSLQGPVKQLLRDVLGPDVQLKRDSFHQCSLVDCCANPKETELRTEWSKMWQNLPLEVDPEGSCLLFLCACRHFHDRGFFWNLGLARAFISNTCRHIINGCLSATCTLSPAMVERLSKHHGLEAQDFREVIEHAPLGTRGTNSNENSRGFTALHRVVFW